MILDLILNLLCQDFTNLSLCSHIALSEYDYTAGKYSEDVCPNNQCFKNVGLLYYQIIFCEWRFSMFDVIWSSFFLRPHLSWENEKEKVNKKGNNLEEYIALGKWQFIQVTHICTHSLAYTTSSCPQSLTEFLTGAMNGCKFEAMLSSRTNACFLCDLCSRGLEIIRIIFYD